MLRETAHIHAAQAAFLALFDRTGRFGCDSHRHYGDSPYWVKADTDGRLIALTDVDPDYQQAFGTWRIDSQCTVTVTVTNPCPFPQFPIGV